MAFQLEDIAQQKRLLTKKVSPNFLQKEITWFKTPFSNKVKEDFYTELGVLLKAGVALKDGLELIAKSQKQTTNKTLIETLIKDIISGKSLSEAIQHKKPFTQYEYYSLNIGEETGSLPKVIVQLGQFFSQKNEQRRNLINALTYPVIIFSTAVLAVTFMLHYVVPMFEDIFRQQGVELPGITKFIISLSGFLKRYGLPLLLGLIALVISKTFFKQQLWYCKSKDRFILKLPFIGPFVRAIYLSQFTQAITLLTASKVPLLNSIQLVKHMIGFYPLQQALEAVVAEILKGESLSMSLSHHPFFDDKMVALVKVAEETNQTEYIFERLNTQYTILVQQQSKTLSTIMEPVIIMVVGAFVGVILIAMYLPMFKLSSVLG